MRLTVLVLIAVAALAQQPQPTMHECGLGMDKAHPCHCVAHTSKVQADWSEQCQREHPDKSVLWCAQQMPDEIREHCQVIEHYGNWHQNEAGDHDQAMPQQCTAACRRSHCRCSDGDTCHIMHDPETTPAPKGKHK